jgi:hypothetical protein
VAKRPSSRDYQVHVVDPRVGVDSHAGRVAEDVEDPDVVALALGWRPTAAAAPGVGDEPGGTHLVDYASLAPGPDDALDEVGVQRALHALGIAGVPALDVVKRGLADDVGVGHTLGYGARRNEKHEKKGSHFMSDA